MWVLFAFGSAFFAGITAILAKCGIRKTDSTVATAVRTIVVLAFSWLMVFVVGSQDEIRTVGGRSLIFLILSGLATGASWLCYFHALQIGDINKVVPIDKSSTVLTILLAFLFLHESITQAKAIGAVLIGAGTFLMIEKKEPGLSGGKGINREMEVCGSGSVPVTEEMRDPEKKEPGLSGGKRKNREMGENWSGSVPATEESRILRESDLPGTKGKSWFFFALGSAVFASLTSILGKVGISGVESNLGTAIRTGVVLAMAWVMVWITGKGHAVKEIPKNELGFICLSGLATGGSWLCYYRALQDGPASVVVPIDKLSILVTIIFSFLVFHEKLSKKSAAGLFSIVAGTLIMLI